MASIFEQISILLVEPSGSMVYHLVIAFIFISVLQPVLSFLPREQKEQRRRVLIGVLALIASRLILFTLALLSILDVNFMANTLPVAEKVINTFDIAVIVWLFAFQKENKLGDIGLALFGLSILAGGVISTAYWSLQTSPIPFTQSSLATGWGVLTLIVLIIGIITLATSKTPASTQGIILCGLLFLFEGLQLLILPTQGDYFPISRMGHLIAFPLLVGILQNFPVSERRRHRVETTDAEEEIESEELDFTFSEFPEEDELFTEAPAEVDATETEEIVGAIEVPPEGPPSQSMPLHIFQNGIAMGGATSAQEICRLFTRFTAHALLADLCLLLTPPDNNGQVHLISGYDLIVQETLEGASFDYKYIPRYKKLVDSGRPIHVMDQGTEKMYDFANLLQVDEIGNFLGYPILNEEHKVIAVLALISPYSKRIWNADDQEYLKDSIQPITKLIERATSPVKDEKSVQSLSDELELSETGRRTLENKNSELAEENSKLAVEIEELKNKLQDLPELPSNVKELQVQIQSLESALSLMETEKNDLMENLITLKEQHTTMAAEHDEALEKAEAAQSVDNSQEFQATIDALGFANEELIRKNLELLGERDTLLEEKTDFEKQREDLSEQTKSLEKKNEELVEANADFSERLAELVEENKTLSTSLEELQKEHNALLESSSGTSEEQEQIKQELENAIEQSDLLQHKLHESEDALHALQDFKSKTNGKAMPNEQAEVIASIAQELRQPMSSISGYTDLLISESVGILGALQKKFLERVKASTDRMHQLLNDLVQFTTIDSGNFLFTLQPLELLDVIDLAIEATSAQFREKEISLRVDIHPDLPKLHTDKDALQQILLHLLQNAGAATPNEGEITLKAHTYDKTKEDVILLSVTDSGEGIPKEDLPRVFSRLYRADNPLIQGVGDTGVGLSIAKTLTEALGGRIWVESGEEVGATYSVLLPIKSPALSQQEG